MLLCHAKRAACTATCLIQNPHQHGTQLDCRLLLLLKQGGCAVVPLQSQVAPKLQAPQLDQRLRQSTLMRGVVGTQHASLPTLAHQGPAVGGTHHSRQLQGDFRLTC